MFAHTFRTIRLLIVLLVALFVGALYTPALDAAITTLSGAIAGARAPEDLSKVGATMEASGVWHSLFYVAGRPGAAAAPTPGLAGAALTSYAGQIPFTNPTAGQNSYIFRFDCTGSVAGKCRVIDRLWHNSGITVTTTTAQTVNSVTLPARDANGATNGDGVMAAIEVSAATTNAGAVTNTTISYTDQSGNAGATGTIASFPATAAAGTFVPFQLAAGDTGIRSIQSITLGTSYVTGTIHLVLYRDLVEDSTLIANVSPGRNAIEAGFVRLFDNTVPSLIWLPTATTAITINGRIIFTQG